jgi:hypothetical protein
MKDRAGRNDMTDMTPRRVALSFIMLKAIERRRENWCLRDEVFYTIAALGLREIVALRYLMKCVGGEVEGERVKAGVASQASFAKRHGARIG